MTNQEIKKKFLFDLEMGRFKTVFSNKLHTEICYFSSEILDYNDYYKLEYILQSLGFKRTTDILKDTIDSWTKYFVLKIKPKNNTYSYYKFDRGHEEYCDYWNEIPDYIEDYNYG